MSYIAPTPVLADPADTRLATPVDPFWHALANRTDHRPVSRLYRLLALATPAERDEAYDLILDHCRDRLGSGTVDAILEGRADA